ncbi:hypothetical protein J5N97_026797 [Dioscorea zingiberensis]|uniref:Uncharacterized protein n=1 Tax=Dioscorea zingiberensis TaxID=325984 RepID=A0A9D5H716_9LILI|nr:hypothetical protein J5N97_026797 [Dioscorea zingiberensis]
MRVSPWFSSLSSPISPSPTDRYGGVGLEKNLLLMVPFQINMVEWNPEKDLLAMIPFQVQLDKPISFEINMAEQNLEKDLLFMLTYGSKVLYRLNLQQLWTISPG